MTLRIAMWSGPRNLSTALMRAFENRPDTAVVDEPLYAAWLAATGELHPLRDAVLGSQPGDWQSAVAALLTDQPGAPPVQYQKHMAHHLLDDFGREWTRDCRNAFLIRAPEAVIASYTDRRGTATLADIGAVQLHTLFEAEASRLGHAPPVIDSADLRASPRPVLTALCAALGLTFRDEMLAWPAGPRASDGAWAPAWYKSVEASTGFAVGTATAPVKLDDAQRRVADAARPYYDALAIHRIVA